MAVSFSPVTRSVALPDGTRALAGLIWDRAPTLAMPVIGAPGWELRTAKHRATLPAAAAARGDTSLLLLLAHRLTETLETDDAGISPGIWLLLADVSEPGTPGYWLGMAELDPGPEERVVRPVTGPEDVFGDAETMLQAITGLASTMSLSGIAHASLGAGSSDNLAGRVSAALEAAGLTGDAALPLLSIDLAGPADGLPIFTRQASVSTRGLAAAGALVAGLAVAAALLPGLIAQAQRPDPVATVPMDLIDALFGWASETVGGWLPEGDLRSLVVDGVIGADGRHVFPSGLKDV